VLRPSVLIQSDHPEVAAYQGAMRNIAISAAYSGTVLNIDFTKFPYLRVVTDFYSRGQMPRKQYSLFSVIFSYFSHTFLMFGFFHIFNVNLIKLQSYSCFFLQLSNFIISNLILLLAYKSRDYYFNSPPKIDILRNRYTQ